MKSRRRGDRRNRTSREPAPNARQQPGNEARNVKRNTEPPRSELSPAEPQEPKAAPRGTEASPSRHVREDNSLRWDRWASYAAVSGTLVLFVYTLFTGYMAWQMKRSTDVAVEAAREMKVANANAREANEATGRLAKEYLDTTRGILLKSTEAVDTSKAFQRARMTLRQPLTAYPMGWGNGYLWPVFNPVIENTGATAAQDFKILRYCVRALPSSDTRDIACPAISYPPRTVKPNEEVSTLPADSPSNDATAPDESTAIALADGRKRMVLYIEWSYTDVNGACWFRRLCYSARLVKGGPTHMAAVRMVAVIPGDEEPCRTDK